MALKEELKSDALALPDSPGVYQFFGKDGRLIYVGKAKSLKRRVASYFGKQQAGKTKIMVSRIASIGHAVVDTESEALLLENNLIKKHQPRYNILLKDDKTFPWVCIKKESFPRVFMTRNVINDGSTYFGPYTSVVMVKTLLGLIRKLYTLRTCTYNLSEERILQGKYKVCLEYHIGNCKAPCVGKQEEGEYLESINQINEILKGNIHTVNRYLKNMMKDYARNLKYEEAQLIKDKLEILEKYQSRSTVVNPRIKDVDVFGYNEDDDKAYVNYLKIIRGAVIQTHTVEIRKKLEESREELLSLAITDFRLRHGSETKEIILPFIPDSQEDGLKYMVPGRGDKQRLLELAERNAVLFRLNQKKRLAEARKPDRTYRNLESMKKDLHLPELPVHIECFDNSNIQGKNPVAACVVFRKGKPYKKDYRHYNIKTVKGADDYASMEEVVFRRYRRLLDEDEPLPQLVIIDGGKGQLNAAIKSIERLNLKDKISVIGIAKRLEEIYFPGDSVPLYIDKNSISLKIIQQLRNEAHRFGINFHRDQRSRTMIKSELNNIGGVGPKTIEVLLRKFGSASNVRQASLAELEKVAGKAKALKIMDFFQNRP